jgi:hypothetical protein
MRAEATADRLVEQYLDELDAALTGLPDTRRRELVSEIAAHIEDGRAELLDSDDPREVSTVLERIGDPAEIAADAGAGPEPPPETWRSTWLEPVALILLVPGSVILPGVGWLAGVVLLWISRVWTTRDKLVGTFVLPGGLVLALLTLSEAIVGPGNEDCAPGPEDAFCVEPGVGIGLLLLTVLSPLAAGAYLLWRFRVLTGRSSRRSAGRPGTELIPSGLLLMAVALGLVALSDGRTLSLVLAVLLLGTGALNVVTGLRRRHGR